MKIPVGHTEAGLKTYDIYSPFPEKFNRQATGIIAIAKYYFAPTEVSKQNLLNEGKEEEQIFITRNTSIDALKDILREDYSHSIIEWVGESKLIMLTTIFLYVSIFFTVIYRGIFFLLKYCKHYRFKNSNINK